jgi:hypothetical protein
MKLPVHNYY